MSNNMTEEGLKLKIGQNNQDFAKILQSRNNQSMTYAVSSEELVSNKQAALQNQVLPAKQQNSQSPPREENHQRNEAKHSSPQSNQVIVTDRKDYKFDEGVNGNYTNISKASRARKVYQKKLAAADTKSGNVPPKAKKGAKFGS